MEAEFVTVAETFTRHMQRRWQRVGSNEVGTTVPGFATISASTDAMEPPPPPLPPPSAPSTTQDRAASATKVRRASMLSRSAASLQAAASAGSGQHGYVRVYRGLRVRMGFHSGIDAAAQIVSNTASRRAQYCGLPMYTTKCVADAGEAGALALALQPLQGC